MKIDLDSFQDILLEAESGEKYHGLDFPSAHEYKITPDSKNDLIWRKYLYHLNYLVNIGYVANKDNSVIGTIRGHFCLTMDGHDFLRISRMPVTHSDDFQDIFSNSILRDLSNKIKESENKKLE